MNEGRSRRPSNYSDSSKDGPFSLCGLAVSWKGVELSNYSRSYGVAFKWRQFASTSAITLHHGCHRRAYPRQWGRSSKIGSVLVLVHELKAISMPCIYLRAHIGPLDASGHFPGREQSAVRKGSAKHMQQQQQHEEQPARNS